MNILLNCVLGGVVRIPPRIYAKTIKYKNDQTRKCFGTASTPPPCRYNFQLKLEYVSCIGLKKWEEKTSYFRVLSI